MQFMTKACVFFLYFLVCTAIYADPTTDIENALESSRIFWNRGDLTDFIKIYKNANDTLYISSSIIKGYENIRKRYVTVYPTAKKMGHLSYTIMDIKPLSNTHAIAVGKWRLVRKNLPAIGGVFSLVFENTKVGWKIVIDHTS